MTNPSISQSQKRLQESLGHVFIASQDKTPEVIFVKSSTDVGVERNGGRNGSRLGPQSLLSSFKKLALNPEWKSKKILEIEVADEKLEREHFEQAQLKESDKILEVLKNHPKAQICHLGGGHDHVYPLLVALSQIYAKIIVINVDAHADTRSDTEAHSGNPFRLFEGNSTCEFKLYQIGLHAFANSFSTLSPLMRTKMQILWRNELHEANLKKLFETLQQEITPETFVVFSLDADALSGYEVPGVSAVNPDGLSFTELKLIWKNYASLKLHHPKLLGIYELNPVYDTVSQLSMRVMSSFIYQTIE